MENSCQHLDLQLDGSSARPENVVEIVNGAKEEETVPKKEECEKFLLESPDMPQSAIATSEDHSHLYKNTDSFNAIDLGLCLFSILMYLLDYAVNGFLFQKYFKFSSHHHDFVAYFWLTFVFVVSTSFITAIFEIVWYKEEKIKYGHSLTWKEWLVRIVIIIALLGPAFRYVELLLFIPKKLHKVTDPIKREKALRKAMEMKADADFFYMLEKFTESGLHVILQMYIVKRELAGPDSDIIGIGETLKIVTCLILMPYTVTVYLRSQRQANVKANNIACTAAVIQFISRFFIIISQAAALSFFLAMYPFTFMIVTVSHFGLMSIWVFQQETKFCRHLWLECIYRFLTAFIYLFNYFNVTGNESYYKALFYYCLIFLERGLMMCFWCQGETEQIWYRWPVLLGYFTLFIGGIFIKVTYYTCHHPTRKAPSNPYKKILGLDYKKPANNGTR